MLLEPGSKERQVFLGDGALSSQPQPTTTTGGVIGKNKALRKVVQVVDEKMLIFDPSDSNPMARIQRSINAGSRIREQRFIFDRVFDENSTQYDVYSQSARPLLDNVLDGYNATVFAYGATGCGKTHTISGNPQDPGLIFSTIKELFEKIDQLKDTKIVELNLSYLEIYNETIRDLLNPEGSKPLVLREDADQHMSVSNLTVHTPKNVHEVMDMILTGNQNRTMSPTEANAVSSRSHAVIQVNVTQKNRTASLTEAHTFATLSVIDLAGSERASATKNRGSRLHEGANINKSLLALGNCINVLCQTGGNARVHVPYRDSKLTRLLKFSLGGNCKTVMIVCISPSSQHYDETLNTLKYADRAKKIKTKVIRNTRNLDRHVGSYLKMISEQKAEIEELRARESSIVKDTIAKRDRIRANCEKSLNEAMLELDSLSSLTSLESAATTLRRRLASVSGWSRQDSRFFDLYVKYCKVKLENEDLKLNAGDRTNEGALRSSGKRPAPVSPNFKRASPKKVRHPKTRASVPGGLSPIKQQCKRVRFESDAASIEPLKPLPDSSWDSNVTSDDIANSSTVNATDMSFNMSASSLTKKSLQPRKSLGNDKENEQISTHI